MKKSIKKRENKKRVIRIILFALIIILITSAIIIFFYIKNNKLENENIDDHSIFNKNCILSIGKQECENMGKTFVSAEINQFIFNSGIFTCSDDTSSWIYIQITKEKLDKCLKNSSKIE